jgi:hypothetical protein
MKSLDSPLVAVGKEVRISEATRRDINREAGGVALHLNRPPIERETQAIDDLKM